MYRPQRDQRRNRRSQTLIVRACGCWQTKSHEKGTAPGTEMISSAVTVPASRRDLSFPLNAPDSSTERVASPLIGCRRGAPRSVALECPRVGDRPASTLLALAASARDAQGRIIEARLLRRPSRPSAGRLLDLARGSGSGLRLSRRRPSQMPDASRGRELCADGSASRCRSRQDQILVPASALDVVAQ